MNGNKLITLNVGGTKFTTTLDTVTRFPDAYLGKMFSGKMQPGPTDTEGNVFIDRSPLLFDQILDMHRTGNPDLELEEEMEFYMLFSDSETEVEISKIAKNIFNDWANCKAFSQQVDYREYLIPKFYSTSHYSSLTAEFLDLISKSNQLGLYRNTVPLVQLCLVNILPKEEDNDSEEMRDQEGRSILLLENQKKNKKLLEESSHIWSHIESCFDKLQDVAYLEKICKKLQRILGSTHKVVWYRKSHKCHEFGDTDRKLLSGTQIHVSNFSHSFNICLMPSLYEHLKDSVKSLLENSNGNLSHVNCHCGSSTTFGECSIDLYLCIYPVYNYCSAVVNNQKEYKNLLKHIKKNTDTICKKLDDVYINNNEYLPVKTLNDNEIPIEELTEYDDEIVDPVLSEITRDENSLKKRKIT
jgi:hypothetical protein